MIKEKMTAKQMICVIVMFIFGSSVLFGVNTDAHQDSWISLLMAIAFVTPMIIIYARIIKLRPGENLFDMAEILFGKVIGKIIIVLMTWYAIHLCALVLRNFSEFVGVSLLINTPQLIVMTLMILVVIYLVKSGADILGKWALITFLIVVIMVSITLILSLNNICPQNILPFLEHSWKSITNSAFKSFSFPFAETVLFLCMADFFKKEDSSYKIYLTGIFIGGLILFVVFMRNLLILGAPVMTSTNFPSLVATRVIQLGDFLARFEGIITINFLFAGITKITVCLIAATKGIAKLFAVKNYKDLSIPTALLVLALCVIIYTNIMEMFDFINIYTIYAIPFQIVIPVAIWLMAEKKAREKKVLT